MAVIGLNRAGILLTLPMALALLGTRAPGSENPQPINACALLTDDEVAKVLETKVSPGERQDSGLAEASRYVAVNTYSSTCLWRVVTKDAPRFDPNLSLGGASYVILNVMQWPIGSGQAQSFLQNFRDAAAEGVIHQSPVALEIADGALWWGDGVAVYKGDRSLGVSVHLAERSDGQRVAEEALARKAAARL